MDYKTATKLVNSVSSIFDKKTNKELSYDKIDIDKIIHKYSNTKKLLYRIYITINGEKQLIKRNNSYRVNYLCSNCSRVNIVNLNNIIRKINRGILKCKTCVNLDEIKRHNHSIFFKNYNTEEKSNPSNDNIKLTLRDKIKHDKEQFDMEDDDYQVDYYNRHLTVDEYNNISSKIISFQNDKFQDISIFEYIPVVKIGNQTKYNPYIYDKTRDVLEKPNYIKYICDSCNSPYITRDLFKLKNKYKLLCKECSFCNKTFKIRPYKNIIKNRITYQGKFELKFIKYCNDNNIIVENGPRIKYTWNNSSHTYIVDFYIPNLGILIELKDNHIWHKQQLQNGKWDAKLKSVENNLKTNILYKSYLLINKDNYVKSTRTLLKNYNEINKI